MNVVDSSGWIEYFADAQNADFFAEPIEQTNQLIVPTISIYEVFKNVFREENHS
jgi:predicted nucleic acid-binding protein